jgi:hypothetical protein
MKKLISFIPATIILISFNFILFTVVKGQHSFPGDSKSGIMIYSENPFYWSYNKKPVLLIGGSAEDNVFQIQDVQNHLDLLVSAGGNYLRCTMSSRDSGNEKPYTKTDGLYDLNQPNPKYWQRFVNFLEFTRERNIIIQVELWATYDFYQFPASWAENVFNPKNNLNYTSEESHLPEEIKHTAQFKVNPFFETVPDINNNELMLKYQKQFIDKILLYCLNYQHVLYCIDNETNARPEWGVFWAKYIRAKAKEKGKTIYITEMWDNWDPTDGHVEGVRQQEKATHPFLDRSKVANTINSPDLYDFVDVSNNNAQNGEVHYKSALYVRNLVKKTGKIRPVNNVKIYGGTIYEEYTKDWAGSFKDGEERFWRNVFAGHASVRFHRPPYGHGLSPLAQKHIKSMRMLTDSMDFFNHVPANDFLIDRKNNEAFCLAVPGKEYAVYFPGQGEIKIQAEPGIYKARWLHIRSATWRNPQVLKNPSLITTPDNDQWVVFLKQNRD